MAKCIVMDVGMEERGRKFIVVKIKVRGGLMPSHSKPKISNVFIV